MLDSLPVSTLSSEKNIAGAASKKCKHKYKWRGPRSRHFPSAF